MYKVAGAAIAALVGMGLAAQAADLNGRSFKDAPGLASYGPGHSWAGLYVGGSAGFGAGDVANTFTNAGGSPDGSYDYKSNSKGDINGAIYGAHIGYNWQLGHVVAGLEAGINGTDMDSFATSTGDAGEHPTETQLNWYATAVGRLGYAEGSWLFYGFGGLAWGNVDTKATWSDGESLGGGGTDHLGWTAGLGVEYAFNNRFSVRVEYSHVDLGEEKVGLATHDWGEGEWDAYSNKVDLSFDAIKIGASYKLSGGDRDIEPLK